MPRGPFFLSQKKVRQFFVEVGAEVFVDHEAGDGAAADLGQHVGDRQTEVDSVEGQIAELREHSLPLPRDRSGHQICLGQRRSVLTP